MRDSDRLWASDHPYYCTPGCFYASGEENCHVEVPSWQVFKADGGADYFDLVRAKRERTGNPRDEIKIGENGYYGGWYGADPDYNLLYRWDWARGTDEGLKRGEHELRLYFMLQRKARPQSVYVKIRRDDEPEIRAWLWTRFLHLARMWGPLSGWPAEPKGPLPWNAQHESVSEYEALEHMSGKLMEAAGAASRTKKEGG